MATPLQRQNNRMVPSSAVSDDDGSALAARLLKSFVDHPASMGETYREHLRFAARFGGSMVGGGLACLVHALFPSLFQTTGSRTVRKLHERLDGCRPMAPRPPDAGAATPSRSGDNSFPRLMDAARRGTECT